MVRDNGTLFGKPFHMLRLATEIGLRNQQREIGVLHAILLETTVHRLLDTLPNLVSVRLDDHTATHSRLLGEVSLNH